jgi:dTDP-glucose 4,6-dehydratase
MVEGLVRLASSEERMPVNLGNPVELTILEFAERIKRVMHAEMKAELPIVFEPLPEDDPQKRRPDISKAKRVLGWEPKVALEDGLRQTVEYFKALTVTR